MVNIFLSAVSGAILSAAFAPLSLWWVAPLAVALHMYCINRFTRPFLSSFIFALTFNALALHWTSIYVGATPWLILTFGQALISLPLGFAKKYGIALYPFIFIVLEELRNRFPFQGFGWLRIAYSQADAPYRRIAAFGGATGLSAMTLVLALTIFMLSKARINLLPLLPLTLLLIPLHMHVIGVTKAILVQGDVPQLGLDFNSRATQVFYNHLRESKKALVVNKDVDFILWPENSVDVDPFTYPGIGKALDALSKPLIIGAVIREKGRLENTSILWTKDSKNVYVKTHLTPFGEYIPLRALARKISPLVDSVEDFTPGRSTKVFTIRNAKIAPIICFELIDDSLVQKAVRHANLIVVQTNNATFGKSSESAQQLSISRIRAIEYGRNILSVSTTGISATINYNGDIGVKTPIHTPAYIFSTPALIDTQTPRAIAGDWAGVAALMWLLLIGALPGRIGKYRR